MNQTLLGYTNKTTGGRLHTFTAGCCCGGSYFVFEEKQLLLLLSAGYWSIIVLHRRFLAHDALECDVEFRQKMDSASIEVDTRQTFHEIAHQPEGLIFWNYEELESERT